MIFKSHGAHAMLPGFETPSALNMASSLTTTAQRCSSETETLILEDLFSSVLSQFKKYHPSGNLKFNNLGISQSLIFGILKEKILSIFLTLNFTANTLGF